jgi:hypothetical protein
MRRDTRFSLQERKASASLTPNRFFLAGVSERLGGSGIGHDAIAAEGAGQPDRPWRYHGAGSDGAVGLCFIPVTDSGVFSLASPGSLIGWESAGRRERIGGW